MFTFTVAVFNRSELDLEADDFAVEFLPAPLQPCGRVTVRALTARAAAAAAYYQLLGRHRAAFLRQLGTPAVIRSQEDDLTRIQRELVVTDVCAEEFGLAFDYALDRTGIETFLFAVRPAATRRVQTARRRNPIPLVRASRLTMQLLCEPAALRRN